MIHKLETANQLIERMGQNKSKLAYLRRRIRLDFLLKLLHTYTLEKRFLTLLNVWLQMLLLDTSVLQTIISTLLRTLLQFFNSMTYD